MDASNLIAAHNGRSHSGSTDQWQDACSETCSPLPSCQSGEGNKPGTPKRHTYKDVVGKRVSFPASYFGVDVPGLFYEGHVQKKDPSRTGFVIVTCKDDPSRYFVPVEEVKQYHLQTLRHHAAQSAFSLCSLASAADNYAAEVLVGMKHATVA